MKILSASVFITILIFCVPAGAAFITISDLPDPIQTCISDSDCGVNTDSIATAGNATIFVMTDGLAPGGADPDTKFLVRYGLTDPSAIAQTGIFPYPEIIDSYTPITGYLWLLVNDQYSVASNAHLMTAYMDKSIPPPLGFGPNFGDDPVNLTLTTTDLLDGSAYVKSGWDEFGDTISEGALIVVPEPPLLAEFPTWYLTELNLVYLNFFESGGFFNLSLNAGDNRGLVLGSTNYWSNGLEYGLYTHEFYTQPPVPLPSAAWLFGSGLLGLIGIAKKRKAA